MSPSLRSLRFGLAAWLFTALAAGPAFALQSNDSCANAQPIAGTGTFNFDCTSATTGPEGQSESLCYAFGSAAINFDVWFVWTADCTGGAVVTTCNLTADDTKIAAYPVGAAGCPAANSALACNDDTCQVQSEIIFQVVNGTSYMIQVGYFPGAPQPSAPGQFQITSTGNCGGGGGGPNYGITSSMDYKDPFHGEQDSLGNVMRESDMCMPPEGVPGLGGGTGIHILLDGADLALPLYALCTNPQPGTPCFVEVDGFSRGRDHLLQANGGPGTERDFLFFSVDEWAKGDPQNPQAPSVTTEGASGGQEASADVFKLVDGLFPGPIPPPNPSGEGPWGNIAVLDGDGKRSASGFQYPGCGLKEPNPPSTGPLNAGSNSDSMNLFEGGAAEAGEVSPNSPVFFSLDGNLQDILDNTFGSGSSFANGQFLPGDILMSGGQGTQLQVYATSQQLGLDLLPFAMFKDDIDALILSDDGDGVYEPATAPYEWLEEDVDMLLFSVRRGSPIIGQLDSIFGLPICEGDILIPPVNSGGGLVGVTSPGIFVAAEAMGLRAGRDGKSVSDDLNSADTGGHSFYDCNGNRTEDAVDIANGTSDDLNTNGVPDECEDYVEFCSGQDFASGLVGLHCPCGNCDPTLGGFTGCANGTGLGGKLRGSGSTSIQASQADWFTLSGSQLIASQPGLYFQGNNAISAGSGAQFGDGLRCVGGSVIRLQVRFAASDGTSNTSIDIDATGGIVAGQTKYFQLWYRDPNTTPCGSGFNLTNGLQVVFGA